MRVILGIKKQIGLWIMTAVRGPTLIGGGSHAYFSDSEASWNTFAAGTLDLALNPTTIIDVKNIKLGDWIPRVFKLLNNGTFDIGNVTFDTDYAVTDIDGNNGDDFGKHIEVEFLYDINNVD